MPPMKIQPIDIPVNSQKQKDADVRNDVAKPVLKSRFKRLFEFDRQSPNRAHNFMKEEEVQSRAHFAELRWCRISWRKVMRNSHRLPTKELKAAIPE